MSKSSPSTSPHGATLGTRSSSDDVDDCDYNPGATDLLNGEVSKDEVTRRATQLASDVGLNEHIETFKRGAHLAHDPRYFYMSDASQDEKEVCST